MNKFYERILQLVDYYGDGNTTFFANFINCSESNIRSWKNGTLPKLDMLQKIAKNCEKVSLDWLLIGEGAMLKNDESINKNQNNDAFDVKFLKEQNHELMMQIAELNKQIGRLENELQNYRQEYDNKPCTA